MSAYLPPPTQLGNWDDALLAPVAEVNDQMLELLKSMAAAPAMSQPRVTPRLVQLLREHWRRLDARAQRRLSACPYLLLDADFAQTARWQRLLSAGVMDAPARGGYFSGPSGVSLIRRMLLLAWHLARSNRLMAAVTLGLTAPVAERIAATPLKDLEAIAELAPAWIAPRWEQQTRVWQQLITAACSEHPLALRQAQLRGLQLLAREHTRADGGAVC
ncbi:MAG TPA: hypothetical protein VNZ06_04415 [Steroidobacteraceae bacterium]|jgi:hypothetical protein|nr:hypothetical protein [Steroidobacteraceae bacterium]